MTRRATYQHTTTIQVWPGGESYTYRGDPEGDTHQRSLQTSAPVNCAHCHGTGKRTARPPAAGKEPCPCRSWRKGTPAEWAAIVREVRAARLAEREVYCCDSGLVDDLLKNAGDSRIAPFDQFKYEEIRNLYADPSDWDAAQCREWLDDHGYGDHTDCVEDDPETCLGANAECLSHGLSEGVAEQLRVLIQDRANDYPAEVFEWWRVSQWLCDALHAIGEVTIDNEYGCWFGRTVTGQNMIMDGTFQRVADHLFAPADAAARAERLVVKP